jgi:hypothetical protein
VTNGRVLDGIEGNASTSFYGMGHSEAFVAIDEMCANSDQVSRASTGRVRKNSKA